MCVSMIAIISISFRDLVDYLRDRAHKKWALPRFCFIQGGGSPTPSRETTNPLRGYSIAIYSP